MTIHVNLRRRLNLIVSHTGYATSLRQAKINAATLILQHHLVQPQLINSLKRARSSRSAFPRRIASEAARVIISCIAHMLPQAHIQVPDHVNIRNIHTPSRLINDIMQTASQCWQRHDPTIPHPCTANYTRFSHPRNSAVQVSNQFTSACLCPSVSPSLYLCPCLCRPLCVLTITGTQYVPNSHKHTHKHAHVP